MPTFAYPALVSRLDEARCRARFPDVAGLEPEAALPDLLPTLRTRLLERLRELERDGSDWPQPTPLPEAAAAAGPGEATVLVDVQVDDAPVRVNISIGERLLRRLDAVAEAQDMTRSGFIAAAVRQRLGDDGAAAPGGAGATADTAQRLSEEIAAVGRKLNEAVGPESAFSRTVSELDARALEGLRRLADGVASAMNRRSGSASGPASGPASVPAEQAPGPDASPRDRS